MPLRRLTARERSPRRNHALGAVLAFIAGAVDVCGYLRLGEYTSHVTGTASSFARDLAALHHLAIPATILLAFIAGAAISSILIQWIARRGWESEFALPILLEAVLLALLAFTASPAHRTASLGLLAFTMGLQNAMITRLSHKEIRTTHITGLATDIGIQLGRALYVSRHPGHPHVRADRAHLVLLLLLTVCFLTGGIFGAIATPRLGFHLLLIFAALLAAISLGPIAADLRRT